VVVSVHINIYRELGYCDVHMRVIDSTCSRLDCSEPYPASIWVYPVCLDWLERRQAAAGKYEEGTNKKAGKD